MLLSLRFTIFYCYVRAMAFELLIHPVDCMDIRRVVYSLKVRKLFKTKEIILKNTFLSLTIK